MLPDTPSYFRNENDLYPLEDQIAYATARDELSNSISLLEKQVHADGNSALVEQLAELRTQRAHLVGEFMLQNEGLQITFAKQWEDRTLFDHEEVKSIAAEALARAAWGYDGAEGAKFSPYYFVAAKNALLRELESLGSHTTYSLSSKSDEGQPAFDVEDYRQPPKGALASAEKSNLVRSLLDTLEDPARRVVCLYFGLEQNREHSQAEIITVLGLGETRVNNILRSFMATSRQKLNKILEDHL